MTGHEQQSASSSTPSTTTSLPLETKVQQRLNQAQQDCHAQRWLQVIHHCEAAIEQCHHYLSQPSGHTLSPVESSKPSSPESLGDLHEVKGDLFKREGQVSQAIQAYQQALQHQPEVGSLHAKLAELYEQQGQPDDAIAHYQKAVALEPNLPRAQAKLASLYTQNQQWDSAIPHYEQALALSPQSKKLKIRLGQAHYEAGHRLKTQGKTDNAGWAYLKALQLHPHLFAAYTGLRYDIIGHRTIRDSSQYQSLLNETIKVCRQIIQQHPKLVLAHTTLGYTLTQADKIPAAAECYRHINAQVARNHLCNAGIEEKEEYQNPDFIIIGTQKGGTTSLYQYLRRHPNILSPVEKEINFFSWEYKRGLDWYLSHFPPMPCQGDWVTGEVSPHYLYSRIAPQRILEAFPEIQLGVVLRNPIDRAVSHYHMMARKGEEKRKFSDIVAQEIKLLEQKSEEKIIPWRVLNRCPYLGSGLYYHHLERWFKVFPHEKIFIIQSEELLSNPEKTLNSLYNRLGLAPHVETEYPKHHVGSYPPISDELKQLLSDFFTPHIHKLEHQLSRHFNW